MIKVNELGDFTLVWRDTYPEDLNLNLDLISELKGAPKTCFAKEVKASFEKSETDKPEIARELGLQLNKLEFLNQGWG